MMLAPPLYNEIVSHSVVRIAYSEKTTDSVEYEGD